MNLYHVTTWLPEMLETTLVLLGLVKLKLILHSIHKKDFYIKINKKRNLAVNDILINELKDLYPDKDKGCLKFDDLVPGENKIINDSRKNFELNLLRVEL